MSSGVQNFLVQGIKSHKAGDLFRARENYRRAIRLDPENADARHNLGVLCFAVGDSLAAQKYLQEAISINPRQYQYWYSYINLLLQAGEFQTARKMIKRARENGIKANRLASLIESLKTKPLENSKALVEGCENREFQVVKKSLEANKIQEASIASLEFCDRYPKNPLAKNLVGVILAKLGHHREAIHYFNLALGISADFDIAWFNLANALDGRKAYDEKLRLYKKSILLNPIFCEAYNNFANFKRDSGRLKNSQLEYKKLLQTAPHNYIAHNNLGVAKYALLQSQQALWCFKKALIFAPAFRDALSNLVAVYRETGHMSLAKKTLLYALCLQPHDAKSLFSLVELSSFTREDPAISLLEHKILDSKTSDEDKVLIGFALGKAHCDMGSFSKSFKFFKKANDLRRMTLEYSTGDAQKLVSQIKAKTWNFEKQKSSSRALESSQMMIFVIGMPRSGTSLVEQILASHSDVFGAGEVELIGDFASDVDWTVTEEVSKELIDEFRERYTSHMADLPVNHRYVVDKMPLNFLWLGIINQIFPRAKIVHIERDVMATCWSIYRSYFASNGNTFAYNLDEIADFYKLYKGLMQFWETQSSGSIFNIKYEKLVAEQKKEVERLLNFLDLPWEDNCLEFYKTERAVKTASAVQIRKAIYHGSSDAWMEYRAWLSDLEKHFDA